MDFFLQIIYPLQKPKGLTRDRPLHVLALGLSRTGTESLKQALTILGYDHVYHGFDFLKSPNQVYQWIPLLERKLRGDKAITVQDFDAVLGDCEAVSDMPCSAFIDELLVAYPEALVIANQRSDIDAWYKSYAATVDPLVSNFQYTLACCFDKEAYWARRLVSDVQEIHYDGNFQNNGKKGYEAHYERIRKQARDRLLEWTVEDGWEPLCRFLKKSVPDMDFPRGNDPAAFEAEKIRVTTERFQRSDRNMRRTAAALVGFTSLIVALICWRAVL